MYFICNIFCCNDGLCFSPMQSWIVLFAKKCRNFEQEIACPKFQLWLQEFVESWLYICMSRDLFFNSHHVFYKIVRIYFTVNSIFCFLYKLSIMYFICNIFLLQWWRLFFTDAIMNCLVCEKMQKFEQEWTCPKFQLWRQEFVESWLDICMSRDLFSIRTMCIYIGVWCEME